ncbi:MAG TPA: acetylglutamate kinase [Terriglobia bacterium]|jgi:acetylglutamate kinase|nr:acetylglutamate kinase [Terriglobia bacterium]
MRMVIKFAGALLDRPLEGLARQVADLAGQGHELLVVHGGGKIFTATLARLGIKSRFVDGLRVTDRATRDAALMVFGGLLNKQLAAAISAAGRPAIGISAGDAACFPARPLARPADLGFVGELTGANTAFFGSLWKAGLVPVAACLGLGPHREIYNINADQMAAAAAEYLDAERLIYLTDVAGVLDGGAVMGTVNCNAIEPLVSAGTVSGGMVVKLEACRRALNAGVGDVRIIGGEVPGGLLAAASGEGPGTRVVAGPRKRDGRESRSRARLEPLRAY